MTPYFYTTFFYLTTAVLLMTNAQPDPNWTPVQKADYYRYKGQVQKSLQILTALIQKEPANHDAYLSLAVTYDRLGNEDAEEKAFKKAVEVAPLVSMVYERYGDFLSGSKRYYDALKLYQLGAQKIPRDADMYYHLANVLIKLEEYEQALKAINQSIALNDKSSYYYYKRGYIQKN